jgi:beta-hydroxylase
MASASSQNVEGEQVGAINRAFGHFYKVRVRAKEFKREHRQAYYIGKWLMIGSLLWLLFW